MNTLPLFESIEDLVLHRSPMLLLEAVTSWGKTNLEASVDPRDSHLFADPSGAIPAWVGIEYMAQAISARAGISARLRNEPLRVGLLLGTRKYTTKVASFAADQKLVVKVDEILRDETNLVLFDCQIFANEKLLASAEIKAIEPDDLNAVVAQFKQIPDAPEKNND